MFTVQRNGRGTDLGLGSSLSDASARFGMAAQRFGRMDVLMPRRKTPRSLADRAVEALCGALRGKTLDAQKVSKLIAKRSEQSQLCGLAGQS